MRFSILSSLAGDGMHNGLSGAQTSSNKSRTFKAVAIGIAWCCLAWLAFVPSIAAQTARALANKNDSDSLHQFNSSVRALVKRVTPSVVQLQVTGYGPVEGSRATTTLVFERRRATEPAATMVPVGYSE